MEQKILNESVPLLELTRSRLIAGSRNGAVYKDQSKGKNRYARRTHSRVSTSTKEFNQINMDKLFKQDILDVSVLVHGETDDYMVKLSFGGFLIHIQEQLEKGNPLNVRSITKALVWAFNTDDVYIHCSCPDWKYRFGYWALLGDINSDVVGDGQLYAGAPRRKNGNTGPEPNIMNPDDNKGFACKHVLLVLSNNTWLMKVANVIFNYVNYLKEHREQMYAEYIYPALYGKEYEDEVQTELGLSDDDLAKDNTSGEIDTANKWARTKNQFKPGNTQGIRFTNDNDKNQIKLNIDDEDDYKLT